MINIQELPITQTSSLPLFSEISPEQIEPAVIDTIANNKKLIEKLLSEIKEFSWDNFVLVLDEANDHLSKLWSPVSHMNSVVSNDELRVAHDNCLALFSEYGTFVGQHQGLYNAYLAISNREDFRDLNIEKQKVITDALIDFKLAGIALSEDQKVRYGEIQQSLSKLQSKFSNNVLDATQAWSKLITDLTILDGMPKSAIDAAKQEATERKEVGYLLTLDIPSYLPVMTYAKNRELRKEVYTAFTTRASELGPNAGEFDNTSTIDEILDLRSELATLLDFNDFCEYSLATKMAETPKQVIDFLTELSEKSRVQATAEFDEIFKFAKELDNIDKLEAWDLGFYSELLKQERFSISDEMIRPYFPENKVVSGLFDIVGRLFGIKIEEELTFNTWHKDVRFFKVFDKASNHIASFYFDLYARSHKRGGAWMDSCRDRCRLINGELQLPVAYLTCNFNKPLGKEQAIFTHDEVETLFHEFGHGLHHMLTKVEAGSVSGINAVPWDAVELPSQFLENWCWEPEALKLISSHVETGETLPKDLLDKMLAAKNYNSALGMARQLEFSLFDFVLHYEHSASNKTSVQGVLDKIRSKVAVTTPPSFNRFQNSFSHIFAGGYSAGYYSYKWAEVLSADAFSRFENEGIFNKETGEAFLECILEKGGSIAPMELFKSFMGREPKIEPLLRHSGIK